MKEIVLGLTPEINAQVNNYSYECDGNCGYESGKESVLVDQI